MIKKVNVEIRIKEVNSNNNYPTMLFWSWLLRFSTTIQQLKNKNSQCVFI